MSTHASASRTTALDLAERWTEMWNHEMPADDVVGDDCAVYFGRISRFGLAERTTTPAELQAVVDGIHAAIPEARYSHPSPPLVHADEADGAAGLITLLWNVAIPGTTRTGIDILRYRGERIVEVWTVTGDRELPAMGSEPSSHRASDERGTGA